MKLFGLGKSKVVEKVADTVSGIVSKTSKTANATERQKIDMLADSWLSKNIRPLLALIIVLDYSAMIIYKINQDGLTDAIFADAKQLCWTVVGFYFASRGIEKVIKSFSKR
jgi:hypothetical protein